MQVQGLLNKPENVNVDRHAKYQVMIKLGSGLTILKGLILEHGVYKINVGKHADWDISL